MDKKRKQFTEPKNQKFINVNMGIFLRMQQRLEKEEGLSLTIKDIRVKISNLSSKYREAKRKIGTSGGSPSQWVHYTTLHKAIGGYKSNCIGGSEHTFQTIKARKNLLAPIASTSSQPSIDIPPSPCSSSALLSPLTNSSPSSSPVLLSPLINSSPSPCSSPALLSPLTHASSSSCSSSALLSPSPCSSNAPPSTKKKKPNKRNEIAERLQKEFELVRKSREELLNSSKNCEKMLKEIITFFDTSDRPCNEK